MVGVEWGEIKLDQTKLKFKRNESQLGKNNLKLKIILKI